MGTRSSTWWSPNSSYLFVKDTNNLNIETGPWPWHQPLENIIFDTYQSRSKHQTTTHEFKLSTCWAFWKERPPGRVSACRCTVGTWEQLLLLYLNTPLETPTHPSKSFNINTSPSSIHFTNIFAKHNFHRSSPDVSQKKHNLSETPRVSLASQGTWSWPWDVPRDQKGSSPKSRTVRRNTGSVLTEGCPMGPMELYLKSNLKKIYIYILKRQLRILW